MFLINVICEWFVFCYFSVKIIYLKVSSKKVQKILIFQVKFGVENVILIFDQFVFDNHHDIRDPSRLYFVAF